MNINVHTPFRIVILAIIAALTLPVLIRDGMFMDAMLYTAVSKNLSEGIGTFWFPEFSMEGVAGLKTFHEQPPLVFGIQSIFFRVFGNSMYTERIYVLFTLMITIMLIIKMWKLVAREEDKEAWWLPLLIWITVPICFWSFSNNMHENTMGIFTLGALYCYLRSTEDENRRLFLIISGVMIFLASFSKGLPGLFPLGAPVLYSIITRKVSFKKSIIQSFLLFAIVCLIYGCLMLYEPARESLKIYFIDRAIHRMKAVPTVDSHFYSLERLFVELLPALLVTFAVVFYNRKKLQIRSSVPRIAIFMIATGASGALPLMLTKVQKTFYFSHTLPFFGIGLALILSPYMMKWIRQIPFSKLNYLLKAGYVLSLAVIVVTVMGIGKYSRDKEMLEDIYAIGEVIPGSSVISVPSAMWDEWSLQCYFMRYFNINMTTGDKGDYLLTDVSSGEQGNGKVLFKGKKYILREMK